ncbi:MAG: exodeoxyribonuclease VII large subunit, partial [Polyangia bacterium]
MTPRPKKPGETDAGSGSGPAIGGGAADAERQLGLGLLFTAPPPPRMPPPLPASGTPAAVLLGPALAPAALSDVPVVPVVPVLAPAFAEDTAPKPPRIFAVNELVRAVRLTLESRFGEVRVEGEVSGFKRSGPGHLYFCLKDDQAALDCV